MYEFWAHLSTQDVLLQLKEVIDNAPQQGENIILTLDIKGAFDNVSHQAILEGLERRTTKAPASRSSLLANKSQRNPPFEY